MQCRGEIIQILEAFDLTGSYKAAGYSHQTVARYVAKGNVRRLPAPLELEPVGGGFNRPSQQLDDGAILAYEAACEESDLGDAGQAALDRTRPQRVETTFSEASNPTG